MQDIDDEGLLIMHLSSHGLKWLFVLGVPCEDSQGISTCTSPGHNIEEKRSSAECSSILQDMGLSLV